MKNRLKSYTQYEIIKVIASGGMGTVAKAKLKGVEGFEKIVAIKTLLSRYAGDEAFVQRFVLEAKLVANLVHENIVQVYQLDRVNGEYFFVLEFVDGISLYDMVEFHRAIKKQLPPPLAVFIASRAARALGLDYTGVDIIDGPDGPQVIEVNGNPAFDMIFQATGEDMARAVAEHVSREVQTRRSRCSRRRF